jgi:hypothetical protein
MLSAKQGEKHMPVGLFRSEDGWAQVDYRTGATIPIPRSRYEANGYKPDFDKLPSEAEYRAAEEKKDDDARGPKGEKRPADAIGNAVMIARIATGLRISNPPA